MVLKPGYAFGEHIKTEKIRRVRRYDDTPKSFTFRGYMLLIFLGVVLFFLLVKLVSLQFFQGAYYKHLSNSNRIRTQIIHAPRGIIFDRNGLPLVYNTPGFREMVGNKSVHLSQDQALTLLAQGITHIDVDSLRYYAYSDALSHIIGYIGQISQDELKKSEFHDYLSDDWVGKTGIEKEYEHTLRGTDGKELIEVDAFGKKVRSLGRTDPIAGQNITLTIDAKLQQQTYSAAKNIQKGAIIVSTPDGQILAMISKPSFDSNLFTLNSSYKSASDSAYHSVETVLTDGQNQPLLNRAIGGVYPPGSTFKIVVASTGLETHLIDERYHVVDTGVLKLGEFSFANWFYTNYGAKEQGELDVTRALARSNDIFFYKLAELIGVDKLSDGAKKFGLGTKLGIDLNGEVSGLVPSQDWKKNTLHEDWYLGDTYHYGIGQGYLLTTPLQVNTMTQVVANGGNLYRPHLLKTAKAQVLSQQILGSTTTDLIRKGMIGACSPGGVAYPLFNYSVNNPTLLIDNKNIISASQSSPENLRRVVIACKTGTAEQGNAKAEPHAWITVIAPAYDSQIVITVLSEASGEGSVVAAPVAKQVLDAYFLKK